MASTVVVLFTRDLRVHDHPALAAAVLRADRVVPLFVLDDGILGGPHVGPNRLAYLCGALADLDRSLRRLGASLVLRRGDVVDEAMALSAAVGASALHVGTDASAYAHRRQMRLTRACRLARIELRTFAGPTVVAPGQLTPAGGGDHYRVFTPYFRRWIDAGPGRLEPAPASVPGGEAVASLPPPELADLTHRSASPELPGGGETEARARMSTWLEHGADGYEGAHNALAADATSHLGADLHFGCLSPRELVAQAPDNRGGRAWVRQLCWRDFHHQVLAATPSLPRCDYRSRGDDWRHDEDGLEAWKTGRTGIPLVDAGMRQLAREGWMHNRARLVTASFLTRDLYLDWRTGAAHFWQLLVDGDVANNAGNWQWVAGTGNDTRPNRVLNPLRQAQRFDPDGRYVRRYVPELASIEGAGVHRPWELTGARRADLDYPDPLVDHDQAAAEFRARRRGSSA